MAKQLHKFLQERRAKELFLVQRIDDYSTHRNEREAFSPQTYMGGRGGYLWPTEHSAIKAAEYVNNKHHNGEAIFGVFKLVVIVERRAPVVPPLRTTRV